jgi:hypothetical protein
MDMKFGFILNFRATVRNVNFKWSYPRCVCTILDKGDPSNITRYMLLYVIIQFYYGNMFRPSQGVIIRPWIKYL